MRYEPHDYQKAAIAFVESHPCCAVFLDMGLGKTSIALTAIDSLIRDSFEVRRALVVAPLRVARETWPAELAKWDHLKGLRMSVAVGTEAERLSALSKDADVYVINRENVQWLAERSGCRMRFGMIVIDELSGFKSWRSKRFRAMLRLRAGASRVVGLTGTPAGNGLMDLWAEFRVIDLGQRLGRFIGNYRSAYFEPDKRNAQVVFSYRPLPGSEDAIYARISDITMSMRSEGLSGAPSLISTEYRVRLSDSERERYDELKASMATEISGMEVTSANAAVLTGKLSQMANGCVYGDDGSEQEVHSRKLDALEDIVEAANGKPILVAYWFRHDLRRIEERLDSIGAAHMRLDAPGAVGAWNSGSVQVGLIHPASCGHGLNLQYGGSAIVWFGLTWSLELYQQTNARLCRQGQPSKTVVVTHIVADGTVDELMMAALSKKRTVQDALLEAVRAIAPGRRIGDGR